jgi:hypothetical protein
VGGSWANKIMMRKEGKGKVWRGDATTHLLESAVVVFLHTHGYSCSIAFGYMKKMYSESKTIVSVKVVVYVL